MKSNYYVYVYCDPRMRYEETFLGITFKYQPFYIGKGCGKRMYDHLYLYDETTKTDRIRLLKEEQKLPIIDQLFCNLTSNEANYIEAVLIEHFKLVREGGILLNSVKPNVKKWEERSESPGVTYNLDYFDPYEIVKYPTVKYVILKENTLEILSVHYGLDSAAKDIGITKPLAYNLSENTHPYNILRGKILIKRENLLKYFASKNSQ